MAIFNISDELRNGIVNDYTNNGMSVASIAEKYNILQIVVLRTLQKADVSYHRSKIKPSDSPNIIKAYLAYTPTIDIAKQYGCSPRAILKVLNRNGIDTSKSAAGNIVVQCARCGWEITINRARARRTQNFYCCKACYMASRTRSGIK